MVNVAVIGAGHWGKNLVRAFATLPEAKLLYVCDKNDATRKTLTGQYPHVTVTPHLEEVLADDAVDAVAVAVDAPLHLPIARQCLEAGKHTYVEKPLTLSGEDAQTLVDLADASRLRLMTGHLLMYHPAVTYLKGMIERGEIDPLYLYFQRLNLGIVREQENAWWSLAPHDISVACYLLGAQPVRVSATGQAYLQPDRGIEDVVFASLTFADGRMAHIHVSWLDPHKERRVTVVGKRKMVVFDDMQAAEKVRVYDKGAEVKEDVDAFAQAVSIRSGDILIPKIPNDEPLRLECKHFCDAVSRGTQPLSDGRDGLRVVKVLEAGQASLGQGGAVVEI